MTADQNEPKFRMMPSMKKKVGSTYRPYFIFVSFLCVAICIGLVVCAAILKDYDSNLKDEVFHIWVAVPLLLPAIVGVAVFIMKSRKLVIFFLLCTIFVTVLCAAASLMTGMRYWLDGWFSAREKLDISGQCSVKNDVCSCNGITQLPLKVKSCDDMKKAANTLIGEIVLSSLGLIVNIAGVFLGFMSICCGPWKFIDDYNAEHDVDRQVTLRSNRSSVAANVNKGYKD